MTTSQPTGAPKGPYGPPPSQGQPQQFTPPPRPAVNTPPDTFQPGAAAPPPDTTKKPEPAGTPYGFDDRGRVQRTKVSGVWIGLIAAAIVLILLIIFIAQNLNKVGIHFLGFYGQVSLGLSLLVAAIGGVLIAAVIGTFRIVQLRKSLRRNADVPSRGRRKK